MATMTITTTGPQDARIVAAFGRHLRLNRNATGPEVKEEIIDYIRRIVLKDEREMAADTAMAAVVPIGPS